VGWPYSPTLHRRCSAEFVQEPSQQVTMRGQVLLTEAVDESPVESGDGNVRDLAGMCAAAEAGRTSLSSQSFEVVNGVAVGDQVALKVLWTGTIAVPLGGLPAGHTVRAHIAAFLELRDEKIIAQRNHDCYERLTPA
jgi:predicted ester cyclase